MKKIIIFFETEKSCNFLFTLDFRCPVWDIWRRLFAGKVIGVRPLLRSREKSGSICFLKVRYQKRGYPLWAERKALGPLGCSLLGTPEPRSTICQGQMAAVFRRGELRREGRLLSSVSEYIFLYQSALFAAKFAKGGSCQCGYQFWEFFGGILI